MEKMHQREVMQFDVAIIGAGPAGLAAAIRLRQLDPQISVCVLEKSAEIGGHILSGAVIEPRALDELLPDWRTHQIPGITPVRRDHFYLLSTNRALRLPTPAPMRNEGNYIASLGEICRFLGRQAEALGVQIFPGFPAVEVIWQDACVKGVITGDFGRAKDGTEKPGFQPGVEIRAQYTLFAEGCRGTLAERLMKTLDLRAASDPQTYGLGIKEIWQVEPGRHMPGEVVHSVGWPLGARTYGGSFMYHMEGGKVAVGLIVGLDYENPWLDPYLEFQRMKLHPLFRRVLQGGKRIQYGAKALNEGGLQSLPALAFSGGALMGCAAGFLNVPKIKGSHLAMKSGMLAAESVAAALLSRQKLPDYPQRIKNSWVHEELHRARNIRPAFKFGLWGGLLNAALDTYIVKGRAPWTLHTRKADHACLKAAASMPRMHYPPPDGKLTFDRASSVYLANISAEENQPVHLRLKDSAVPVEYNVPHYAAPEERYCPAGVYEMVKKEGLTHLQINAQNCVHCKTCDIKDPTQNITWVPPEGGSGPNYSGM